MEIMVNGQPQVLAPGSTVADIAEARGLVGKGGVAIAVNGAVVRQADWPSRRFEEGDKVVILTAAQGG
jgi:thiamine biosynthesis protein thiS